MRPFDALSHQKDSLIVYLGSIPNCSAVCNFYSAGPIYHQSWLFLWNKAANHKMEPKVFLFPANQKLAQHGTNVFCGNPQLKVIIRFCIVLCGPNDRRKRTKLLSNLVWLDMFQNQNDLWFLGALSCMGKIGETLHTFPSIVESRATPNSSPEWECASRAFCSNEKSSSACVTTPEQYGQLEGAPVLQAYIKHHWHLFQMTLPSQIIILVVEQNCLCTSPTFQTKARTATRNKLLP